MFLNLKRVKLIAWGMAICFLLIHVLMYSVFEQCKVTPMVRVNIFSIIFYLAMLFVVYKEWFSIYAIAIYLEVAMHMTLAVLFTGWGSGFQITLIGMNVLAFYAEYSARALKIKYVRVMPFCLIGFILYIGSYIYLHFNPAPYELTGKAEFWLTILWGVIVFVINLFVLQLLVYIANSSEEKLEFQLFHDKLTGLPNRYFLAENLKEVENGKIKKYWIAIGDIDNFKRINDTYGHKCGDYVLITIGKILGEKAVVCYRWGGEEFIFCETAARSFEEIVSFLDEARKEIENYPFEFEGQELGRITMTFGAACSGNAKTLNDVFREADAKLYEGKLSGKNKVVG